MLSNENSWSKNTESLQSQLLPNNKFNSWNPRCLRSRKRSTRMSSSSTTVPKTTQFLIKILKSLVKGSFFLGILSHQRQTLESWKLRRITCPRCFHNPPCIMASLSKNSQSRSQTHNLWNRQLGIESRCCPRFIGMWGGQRRISRGWETTCGTNILNI